MSEKMHTAEKFLRRFVSDTNRFDSYKNSFLGFLSFSSEHLFELQ